MMIELNGRKFSGHSLREDGDYAIFFHPVQKDGKEIGDAEIRIPKDPDALIRVMRSDPDKAEKFWTTCVRQVIQDESNEFRASYGKPVSLVSALRKAGDKKDILEERIRRILSEEGLL